MKIFGYEFGASKTPVVSVDDLPPARAYYNNPVNTIFDGDKFFNGFGATELQTVDYWTLRKRSAQLFNENHYARGIIRRLITNEINTGLTPETMPDEDIIGVPEESLTEWSETVENRFNIWGRNPDICDFKRARTFGELQEAARLEALVSGDILIVLRQSPRTKLPMVQLVSGNRVKNPSIGQGVKLRDGHVLKHGVEVNKVGRVVAYHIEQDNGTSKRLPAFGEKSGRKLAWLVFGTDKRLDDLRGQPILALVLQSLKEVDRYRDSVQRKAVINSVLAMFIQKDQDKPGTLPVTGGAVRKDTATTTDGDGTAREFNIVKQTPGIVLEELQTGETPVGFDSKGIDEKFGDFEEAIIQSVAWANEIPPEILTLAFSNNYSASQAAINEFKIYLNRVWGRWGETFCTPIYTDWLLSEVLQQRIPAPGLLQAWRSPAQYDKFGAWVMVDWYGSIKPSTDTLKAAKGSELNLEMGLTTRAREARQMTGTKFTKNVKKLKHENDLLAEALRPMLELRQEFVDVLDDGDLEARVADTLNGVVSLVDDVTDG